MKLTKEEQVFFNEMTGLYFPFLIIKRQRGVSFTSDIEELNWERKVLDGRVTRLKFYKHIVDAYSLITLIKYITQ